MCMLSQSRPTVLHKQSWSRVSWHTSEVELEPRFTWTPVAVARRTSAVFSRIHELLLLSNKICKHGEHWQSVQRIGLCKYTFCILSHIWSASQLRHTTARWKTPPTGAIFCAWVMSSSAADWSDTSCDVTMTLTSGRDLHLRSIRAWWPVSK